MQNRVFPPAIVKEESVEHLIEEIKADCAELRQADKRSSELRQKLGVKFSRLKERVPHGQWIKTIEELGFKERTVRSWIDYAKKEPQIGSAADLNSELLEDEEDTEIDLDEKDDNSVKLCHRCQRVGAVKDCPECAALNRTKRPKNSPKAEPGDDTDAEKAAKKSEKDGQKAGTVDAEGHAVAPGCAMAFASIRKFDEADTLVRSLQKLIDELVREPAGERLRQCTRPHGTEDKVIHKLEELQAIKRHLRGTRPHSVCPWCQGKALGSCRGCSGLGWITRTTWKDVDEKTKARLL